MRSYFDDFVDAEVTRTSRALILVPLLVIVAIPVIDHWLPPDVHIASLLVVAPTFTAAFAGPRLTGLIGLLTVAAQVVAGVERHSLGDEQVILEICSLVVVTALLVLFCHLRERRAQQLARTRLVSETAQLAMLRPLPKQVGPLLIATEYRTAEPDTSIGGDLFAVSRVAGSTRLLIGDVRGKGLASIGDTSVMLGAFRAAAHHHVPLPELVASLEDSVRWGLAELSEAKEDVGERFVTAAVLDIPDGEPVIRMVSCGHPPPLRLHDGGATPLHVRRPAPPLGLGLLGDASSYAPQTFSFPSGHALLMYTDGVSEARDGDGAFFPLAERAARADLAAVWADGGPRALLDHLTADLLLYAGGSLDDDMAMIAVQRTRSAGAGVGM